MNMFPQILLEWVAALGPVIVSIVAIWLTFSYQKHAKKLANDRMLKELFGEFNERYDALNGELDTISRLTVEEWGSLDKPIQARNEGIIIDFFNICSEEYYWHNQDRINGNIWASWHKGMNDIFNRSKIIQNLWEDECKNEGYKAYYITKKDEIFNKA